MPVPPKPADSDIPSDEQPVAWIETSRGDVLSLIEQALAEAFSLVHKKCASAETADSAPPPTLIIVDVACPGYSPEEFTERFCSEAISQDVAVLLLVPDSNIDELREFLSKNLSDFLVGNPSVQELRSRALLLVARLRERAEEALSWNNAAPEITSSEVTELAEAPSRYRETVQALKESEAKFRTIANAMPQMVWSTRPDGYHDYYNQQWYDYTGAPEGSTNGDGWNGMFHPDDQARAWNTWHHCLATGDPYEIEYRVRHHSGEYHWTLGRALPVRNEAGDIIRWMGTCTVIHEQKLAEEALKNASRRKDEFLAMLAHELRNPLAPLYNSTVLLRRSGEIGAERSKALDVIERQIKHMTRLVGDLLDVARVTSGKVKLKREPCELNGVIAQAVQDFRYLLDNASLHFTVVYYDDPLWISGDSTRIVQAVGNLLHNAAKFTPAGGTVTLTTNRAVGEKGQQAIVTLEDSGEGIDQDLAIDMFNPFTQADQGLDRGKGGLGLGLALVKGFMELHGGSVTVHSDGKGRGATFTLTFPCGDAPEHVPESQADSEDQCLQRLRIVLIDDNKDMVETLSALLGMDGHDVTTAEDGSTGITAIETVMPDVVICDIGLPGAIDGYDVARTVGKSTAFDSRKPFMIALSGYGHDAARRSSKESGFDIHLLKPLDLSDLHAVLNEHC